MLIEIYELQYDHKNMSITVHICKYLPHSSMALSFVIQGGQIYIIVKYGEKKERRGGTL